MRFAGFAQCNGCRVRARAIRCPAPGGARHPSPEQRRPNALFDRPAVVDGTSSGPHEVAAGLVRVQHQAQARAAYAALGMPRPDAPAAP